MIQTTPAAWMASPITTFSATFLLLLLFSSATPDNHGSVKPPFVASNFLYIDQSGDFLGSINDTFTAAISNPQPGSTNFYLTIYHSATRTVIWCANRNSPISNSGKLNLTAAGLAIVDESGNRVWSTPAVNSTIAALQLLESGNLVLVDQNNVSVWQSFDHPTDTIVFEQSFPAGKPLVGAVSESDWSEGNYEFMVTSSDAILEWNGLVYWRLSMEGNAFIVSNAPVAQLGMNSTGLYLFGESRSIVLIQLVWPAASPDFRVLKIQPNGSLVVMRYTGGTAFVSTDFIAPADRCRIGSVCGKIGLCSNGLCSTCPTGFHPDNNGGCLPTNVSLSLPAACSGNRSSDTNNSPDTYSYIALGNAVDYFSINFIAPVRNGVDLTTCEQLCSANCSCLAIFYTNGSGSCNLIENNLGSIIQSNNGGNGRSGYVKVIFSPSPAGNSSSNSNFPIAGLVLLPSSGVLLILIALLCFERRRSRRRRKMLQKNKNGESSGELDVFSIPGLPVRFEYEELHDATDNFRTQIGSGGFGVVYKGTLKDKSIVAVKKITSMGAERKREFCTEIAIIGNVHHVNLVKLKGFCAQGRDRFLVYEYMNRGSLDRTLFGNRPPLEWQERFDIALGTARGLAYLHSGCDHKIIHCDVKPENILLHENFQVKISDFGLSKLLSPEQSGLFTTMRGTRGYLAPEWLTNSPISDKADVYSYGMVLLELVRGRKNCAMHISSPASSGGDGTGPSSNTSETPPRYRPLYFPLLALEMHDEGRYMELVEPRLMGRVTSEEVEKLVRVALCCVHKEPSLRPTMTNVVGMLEGVLPLGVPRLESLSFLRFYDRRFTEASTLGTGEGEQNEFTWYPGIMNSSTSASGNSFSYMSSQQVSGPR